MGEKLLFIAGCSKNLVSYDVLRPNWAFGEIPSFLRLELFFLPNRFIFTKKRLHLWRSLVKMTKSDENCVKNFETQLTGLIQSHTRLLAENSKLKELIDKQSEELVQAQEQYAVLHQSYTKLKLAKAISVNDVEFGDTQKRLTKLVREVDRCIALLNASEQKGGI